MDKEAFASASKYSGQYCVTASVNRVDFLIPIEVGELVMLKARVNYVENSSMVVGIRVESQNIRTGVIKHCNSSYFSMTAIDKKGTKSKVPGLLIVDNDGLRRFLRSIENIKMRKIRQSEFSDKNFTYEYYKSVLEGFNVKIEI